jgi:hypothetical protein
MHRIHAGHTKFLPRDARKAIAFLDAEAVRPALVRPAVGGGPQPNESS